MLNTRPFSWKAWVSCRLLVLFFGVDLRDGAHGAQQRDALVGEDDRRLLREDIAQPSDGALHVVKPLRGELLRPTRAGSSAGLR